MVLQGAPGQPDRVGDDGQVVADTIMSAASMATSVPEPMARPRSAATSAGPSLTPSPDHGHRTALRLQAA